MYISKEMENIVLLIDDSVKAIIIFILRYNKINKEVIKMYEAIKQLAQKYHQETINQRRDFHHFAERGWLEIRTACQIATTLENLGYEVLVGKEIMDKDARMGLPPEAIFNINYLRAKKEGANPKYLEQVKNGMTAVAGILKTV